jgi:hypothetical protein
MTAPATRAAIEAAVEAAIVKWLRKYAIRTGRLYGQDWQTALNWAANNIEGREHREKRDGE